MGLFDGALDGTGSTADLAARFAWPVVLVIDVRGQAASAAATLSGFANFRPDVRIAGVVFNRVGGDSHAELLRDAVDGRTPVLGAVPRDQRLDLPERHLGLVQAGEHGDLERFLDTAADIIADVVDLDALVDLAARPALGAGAGDDTALHHLVSASRSRAMRRSPSLIQVCWKDGGGLARISPSFPRWPTRPPTRAATPSICPAAIPSCMAHASPPTVSS